MKHTRGDPQVTGIVKKKKVLKIFVQVWNLVHFKALRLWLEAAIPAPLQLLKTLSKIFNDIAVKCRQRFSLNLCKVSETPAFGLKTKRWLCSPTPQSPDLAPCYFIFCSQGWIVIWKRGVLPTLQRFNENRWRPLTTFPLILDNVPSSWSSAEISASSHMGSALKVAEVWYLYDYFE